MSECNHLIQIIYQSGNEPESVTSCYSSGERIDLESLFADLDKEGPKSGDTVNFGNYAKLMFCNNSWEYMEIQ